MNVIDASVAVKWVYDEPGAREARELLQAQPSLTAPVIWRLETTNALAKKQHQGHLSPQEVRERIDYLATVPIALVDDDELLPEALSLSFQLRHPIYDCLYLALALRETSRVLTADRPFVRAAKRCGYHDTIELVGSDQP